MGTINEVLETTEWQDVAALTETTFTDGDIYTITLKGGVRGEVCVSESTPDEGLVGHPVGANENFSYKYKTGEKLFIKAGTIGQVLVLT